MGEKCEFLCLKKEWKTYEIPNSYIERNSTILIKEIFSEVKTDSKLSPREKNYNAGLSIIHSFIKYTN